MVSIINAIIPIFLSLFLGAVIRKKWLKSDDFWHNLEQLSFYVLLPATIFINISESDLNFKEQFLVILALFIAGIIAVMLLFLYKIKFNVSGPTFTSMMQGTIRSNNFITFGVGGIIFGQKSIGMGTIAIITAYMSIIANVASIIALSFYGQDSKDKASIKYALKGIITNPTIIATVLGCCINFIDVSVPKPISIFLTKLGASSFIIGVMIVGARLNFDFKETKISEISVTIISKLFLYPTISSVILSMMNITNIEKQAAILFACIPPSISSYMLAKKMGGDSDTMSAVITISTVLSLVSLWVFMSMI